MRKLLLISLAYLWVFGIATEGMMAFLIVPMVFGGMPIEEAFVGACVFGFSCAMQTHWMYDLNSNGYEPCRPT